MQKYVLKNKDLKHKCYKFEKEIEQIKISMQNLTEQKQILEKKVE